MDSITHTLIAVALLAIAFYTGKWIGRTAGIESLLNYLLNYGACTEDDIKRANEQFERDHFGE